MSINPILAISVILLGLTMALVGIRFLKVGEQPFKNAGFWLTSAGFFAMSLVVVMDPMSVVKVVPAIGELVKDLLAS